MQINVRLSEVEVEKLDEWRRARPDLPSRPAALWMLALTALGAATSAAHKPVRIETKQDPWAGL